MSDQKMNGEAKRLTLDDPVPPETIQKLRQVQEAQAAIAVEFINLEERKIQLLAGNKKLREQYGRVFEALLIERGLSPDTLVDLDGKTGKIRLSQVPQEAQAPSGGGAPPDAQPS